MYDITLLTDPRYIDPKESNIYIANVLKEDEFVLQALKEEGLNVNRVAWDEPDFDWSSTKYALFRAVWDYFDRYDEFSAWFAKTAKKTRFINPKTLIDWNIDKHYLKDLNKKGINIPKTLFIEAGESLSLLEALGKAKGLGVNSDEFVLKPCVGGGARHTYKFHLSDWEKYNTVFQELVANEAMMLQEFQKNIVAEGEISMMVFNGSVTHAVLKQAKKNDFRVQDDWGGTVHSYDPNPEEIDFALNTFAQCPEYPIYGRADIFKDNEGNIALAELEVFEPELWFRKHPDAATVLAKSIKKKYFQ